MVVLLLMVFNGLILFVAMGLVMSSVHPLSHYQTFLLAALSTVLVCALAFLFHSPLGQLFLRWMSGARKPILREEEKLNPIIERVQHAIQEELNLSSLRIQLRIIDEPLPNAFAVGRDTLIVSRALYETATEDELAGVIAHELGHLHNGDSTKLGIALGVSVVSLTIAWVAGIIAAFIQGIGRALSGAHEAGALIGLTALLLSLFAWFFLLFVHVGNWVLRLIMLFTGRKQEYRADQFAIQAGFGAGLLSYLDKIKNMQFDSPKGLLGRLYATHPQTMLRIGKMEKVLQQ